MFSFHKKLLGYYFLLFQKPGREPIAVEKTKLHCQKGYSKLHELHILQ